MDIAFLVIRIVLGLYIAAHGSQKLFGWFGGYGLQGTGGFFESLGFRPGRTFAFLAGAGELAGGILTLLGIGGALGPAIIVMVMLVAALAVHAKNGFFSPNGIELNVFYVLVAVAIAFAGSGAFSLDRVLGLNVLTSPVQVSAALVVAVIFAALNLVARRPVEAQAQ